MDAQGAVPILPVRRLHNFIYCPRLFYLQWVENLFMESEATARGDTAHQRVDRPTTWREDAFPENGGVWRSLEVESERLGICGVMDLVEIQAGAMVLLEYKVGTPMRGPEGAWVPKPSDAIQIAAYALLLEEYTGHPPTEAHIYYAEIRRRVPVPLTPELADQCRQAIISAKALAASDTCPPPLHADVRCLHCSAYPFCLPGETRFWQEGDLDPEIEKRPPRPPGQEGEVLVVQMPRASVNLRGGEIQVQAEGQVQAKRPIEQVRHIYLYGAIQVTAQALHALLERGVSISYFSPAGRFLGMAQGLPASGVDARRGQYRMFERPDLRLLLAKEAIRAKLHNQRVLLMRNGRAEERALADLAGLRDAVGQAQDLDGLRGLEGAGAAIYFQNFHTMLKDAPGFDLDWRGRNRRPPRDPVNAMLSLGYSILAKELAGICHSVGLDPFLGFFHQPRFGRPALALDLMEEFRPLIVDSVVISLVNRAEVGSEDFTHTTRGVHLSDEGRRHFWRAWARRMETEVTHPDFGYRMSYRRMMEVQARQLWRFCRGECNDYHGFVTR
jgi:CRISPR-associated protein Cas1